MPGNNTKRTDDMNAEFIRGFAEATGLSTQDAQEQWAGFSRGLSDAEIEFEEAGGYQSGVAQGGFFRTMFPN